MGKIVCPNFIAKERKNHGLNQGELAKLLDISRGYLSELENGYHKPGSEITTKLEILFGKASNEFLFVQIVNSR